MLLDSEECDSHFYFPPSAVIQAATELEAWNKRIRIIHSVSLLFYVSTRFRDMCASTWKTESHLETGNPCWGVTSVIIKVKIFFLFTDWKWGFGFTSLVSTRFRAKTLDLLWKPSETLSEIVRKASWFMFSGRLASPLSYFFFLIFCSVKYLSLWDVFSHSLTKRMQYFGEG